MTSQLDPAAPLFVILNAASGSEPAEVSAMVVRDIFDEAGREHELLIVERPGGLAELARQAVDQAKARSGAVVVAGGDGTIGSVAQMMLGSGCPFGVLPQGTFNYFGRAHGISTDTSTAARQLLSAHIEPVQVGLVNDHVFLVNASLGVYAELLEEREGFKRQLGRSRAVALVSALSTLLREHGQLQIELQLRGERHAVRTPSLFIANNRLQLEQVGIPQAPVVEAGRLVALLLAPMTSKRMLQLMALGALGRLSEAQDVESFVFERMVVRSRRKRPKRRMKVATDGEVLWLDAPLELRVAPERLNLLKPDPRAEHRGSAA